MRSLDLLVAGAGPAGATLALVAARAGLRVMLVDRDRFPRDKVCGEFLSAEGCAVLDRLGLLAGLRKEGAPAMDGCRITDRRGRALDVPLPALASGGRAALGVTRHTLDLRLVEAAVSAGAELRDDSVVGEPVEADGRVRGVRIRRRDRTTGGDTIGATAVVAADGRRSPLAGRLAPGSGDPRRTSAASWFGLKCHVDAGTAADSRLVELHLFDGGYAGLAPVEGGRLNLCLLTRVEALRACGGRPGGLLRRRLLANPALRARLGKIPDDLRWQAVGPLRFNCRLAAARGVLFVGDAAGTVDPFCGEGMSNALCGAELALPHVLRAVDAGGIDDRIAAAYRRRWRGMFAAAATRGRLLGALLERPALATPLLALLRGPGRPFARHLVAASRTGVVRA